MKILRYFKILPSIKDITVIKGSFNLEEPNFNMKTYGQRAFSVAAPQLWNKLPIEIRACSDVNLFKS